MNRKYLAHHRAANDALTDGVQDDFGGTLHDHVPGADQIELALAAMEEEHIADKVVLCHDGAEVLDYLYCRGQFKSRLKGNPAVVFLDLKMPKVNGLEVLRTIKIGRAHV